MIRPRRHAHRGSVLAAGFVIDTALVGWAEAQRRVLALWTPGALVHEHRGHLLVTGLPVRRVRAHLAPGAPIVAQHGVLATMPIDADEAATLAAPGAVAVGGGGAAELVALHAARAIDVAGWIDLADFEIAQVEALAPPPVTVAVPPPPPSGDVRSLTGIAAAHADMAEVATALVRARAGALAAPGRPPRWRRLLRWFADRLARRGAPEAIGAGAGRAKPSWLDRLRNRIAMALWRSRLGEVLGRAHADYLRRLLELFDRGQLDEALRHAIPLGDDRDPASRIGVAVPRPRDDLRLSFAPRRGGGAAIPIGDAAMAMMRERYRAAAERLERAGRIDEAAFVLAELLADVEAAIALLERHGRYALAARLAEARELAPGLVVRLWFLAGDRERAITCARRHRAWADAAARLERSGDPRAAALRMMWANHLADTGDFAQAVEVAWSIESARALLEAWIDRGIAAAGAAGARLLVRKLVVAPASFPAVAPAIRAVLGDRDVDAPRWRHALAAELVASPPSAELRTMARPALRAMLRDAATGAGAAIADLRDRLVGLADDAALRADLPAVRAAAGASGSAAPAAPLALRWPMGDAGVLPVYDAAALPGARFLVALGELGAAVLDRNGRIVARIDQPAARLAVSDLGTRAVAIAPRGSVQRLARLDLIERRGAHWCDVELDSAARSFDGDLWIAARGRTVVAVDTTGPRWKAVWGVDIDPAGATCAVRREGGWFAVEASAGGSLEYWYYEGFTLRRRRGDPPGGAELVAARPSAQAWIAVSPGALRGPDLHIELDYSPVIALEVDGDAAVVGQRQPTGVLVTAVHLGTRRLLAVLGLDGATAVSLRLAARILTLADDRGRLIVVDLEHGALRRDLRVG